MSVRNILFYLVKLVLCRGLVAVFFTAHCFYEMSGE